MIGTALLLTLLAGPVPSDAEQLLLVVSADWASPSAELRRFQRDGQGWRAVDAPVPVMLGKSGLGWGVGLHGEPPSAGPRKQEGDGRATAGVFALGDAWGYAAAAPAGARWPYHLATPTHHCVDDVASPHYNRIVDAAALGAEPWRSSELLRRNDHLYTWLIDVRHNQDPAPSPGRGSCIFLHVWRAPGKPTVGCTAMAEPNLVALLNWLDPAQRPVLVQLPRPLYAQQRLSWGLP